MKRSPLVFDFYFITDRILSRQGVVEDVGAALRAGVKVVQYREKALSLREAYVTALEIGRLCRQAEACFIVNDRVDLALAVGADGVHIGPKDIPLEVVKRIAPGLMVGVSANTVEQALEFQAGGADYIAASPVFFTHTKADLEAPGGLELVRSFACTLSIPFTAIGGIHLGNVDAVVTAGARSVCAISATVGSEDVEGSVREFRRRLKVG